jgi:hypothetical protein
LFERHKLIRPSSLHPFAALSDRKRRRSDASDDRRDTRPRIDDREGESCFALASLKLDMLIALRSVLGLERTRLTASAVMRNPEELETLVSKADWHAWFRVKHAREVRGLALGS